MTQETSHQQQQGSPKTTAEPLRVLAAALTDGAADLNASQLAQVWAAALQACQLLVSVSVLCCHSNLTMASRQSATSAAIALPLPKSALQGHYTLAAVLQQHDACFC